MADLITMDEYKGFASITGNKTNDQISALITACSSIVESVLGFSYSGTGDESITLVGGRSVYFIDGVNNKNDKLTYTSRATGTKRVLDPSEYVLDSSGKLMLINIIPDSFDTIELSSSAASTVPDDIKLATMLLVKHYYKEDFNKSTVAAGGQQVNYITGNNLPPHVRTILLLNRVM